MLIIDHKQKLVIIAFKFCNVIYQYQTYHTKIFNYHGEIGLDIIRIILSSLATILSFDSILIEIDICKQLDSNAPCSILITMKLQINKWTAMKVWTVTEITIQKIENIVIHSSLRYNDYSCFHSFLYSSLLYYTFSSLSLPKPNPFDGLFNFFPSVKQTDFSHARPISYLGSYSPSIIYIQKFY